MMTRRVGLMVLMVILGVFFFSISIYSSDEYFLTKGSEKGIAFISGGVGLEEREILKEMGKEYSLKLMFSDKKGEYLSNIIVKIFDPKGKSILTTVSNGPWLFIDLPFGKYNLEAGFKAEIKKISLIDIVKGAQKVVSIQW
jgi:hypothetical protein